QTSFKVNLCSGNSVVTSPVYYLQQDDVIYVEPNEMRARQSTVNGNNVRSTSFWISVASLAASVGTFLLRASSTK
ncbi:MAG: polysaccharide export protein, partial [Bacteroidales bacterium]|nr:polysaccharide export protein [Bacteroidales bacterium]